MIEKQAKDGNKNFIKEPLSGYERNPDTLKVLGNENEYHNVRLHPMHQIGKTEKDRQIV